jgi:predicted enzyme related to lactoylglutathione lyase
MTSYRHGVPCWVDVSAPDVDATIRFYGDVFGWEVTPDMGPEAGGYRLFHIGGKSIAGVGPLTGGYPSWTTYINVSNVEATVTRIEPLGGTVMLPTMEIPNDSGRMAMAIDPTGGFFGLFEAGPNHFGAALVNEPNTVTWNELNVRDLATAKTFYDSLLDWSTAPMEPDDPAGYHLANVSGRPVAGMMMMGDDMPADVPTNWLTYFAVADIADTIERCTAAGGGTIAPTFDTPVGQMAVMEDPSRAVFALGQFVEIDDPNDWPD